MKKFNIKFDRLLYVLAIIVMGLCAVRCGNPGTPTGGPRDRKPPVMITSTPAINSTGFSGSIVTIEFDENIQVKDATNKFVVSPPLPKQPKVEGHANVINVRMDSDTILAPGTTYTFDFADCVSDLNEGNTLDDFTFTFSTGESTDSMMISGNLFDASNITPLAGIYVILQSNLADTAFRTVAPIRIAKTDTEGRFQIKNVPAERNYRIYALDDKNRNFLFDQPGEMIAWLADTVRPSWEIRHINDSVLIDSLSTDTLEWKREQILRDTLVYTPDSLTLFAFMEETYDQYITSDERKVNKQLRLTFNNRMPNKPLITFPGQDNNVSHSVNEYSLHNDTVTVWLTDSLVYKGDSVVVAVHYPVLDSIGNMVQKSDTLDLWFIDRSENDKSRRRNKKEKEKKVEVPTLKLSMPQSIGSFAVLPITSETPFSIFEWDSVKLYQKVDTLYEQREYTIEEDTVNLRRKALRTKWEPGAEYKLTIDSAAVRDIYGLQCRAIEAKIMVNKLDKYGTLYINVDSVPDNALLQLVSNNKDETVTRQNIVPPHGKVAFRYVKPGSYKIRLLLDTNHNGKWDTGNYDKRIQPETLIYYMETVNARANWDIKIDFETKRFTPMNYAKKFKIKNTSQRR